MKRIVFGTILALSLLIFAGPQVTFAQSDGSSVAGKYQFSLGDGYTKYLEFEASAGRDGSATGQMMFSDEAEVIYEDVDGTGEPGESLKGFYVKVEFDELVANRNQAVMSGIVRDSSSKSLVGQRMLLTVEDNGDNSREPDKLTWGIYPRAQRGWTPSDAELEEDDGWRLTWIATDAERKDDEGVPIQRDIVIGSKAFALASYSFVDVEFGAGDIVVTP